MTISRPAILCFACLTLSCLASADDTPPKPQFSVGIKVWNSSWSSYLQGTYAVATPAGKYALADAVDQVEGERRTATFPVLGMRYRDIAISASYAQYASDFRADHSSVLAPNGMSIATSRTDHIARKESDLTAAYFLTPNIGVSVGYKYAEETRDTTLGITGTSAPLFNVKGKGIVFGALANFPIQGGLRFYGQLGYGPTRLTTTPTDATVGTLNISGQYLVSEIGLNYALAIVDPYVKGAYASIGYRSQVQKTHSIGLAYMDGRDYRDTKDGLVLSLTVAL